MYANVGASPTGGSALHALPRGGATRVRRVRAAALRMLARSKPQTCVRALIEPPPRRIRPPAGLSLVPPPRREPPLLYWSLERGARVQ